MMERPWFREPLLWLLLAVPVVFAAGLCLGAVPVPLSALFAPTPLQENILVLRAHRLLCAFAVGGALALSGTAYQAALRNPLVEPFILGISGGASLGAALAIVAGLAAISGVMLPAAAFGGGLLALLAVLLLARGQGSGYTVNVALSGIVVGSFCSSLLMYLVSISNSMEMNGISWWMLGSLQPGSLTLLAGLLALLAVATVAFFAIGRDADALQLGAETAHSLGVPTRLVFVLLLVAASLLTAMSVALAGIIGFVGLIVPHLLRRLFGATHRRLFPLAAVGGGLLLMVCDTLARSCFGQGELPVGVITSLLGGPFFLWIVKHGQRGGLGCHRRA